jgi:hypothetical protein
MKQTAVEWLGNEITNRITRRNPHDTIIIQTLGEVLIELIEQAKEMEKEQIIKAHNKSWHDRMNPYKTAEQYYNETFKSE